MLFGLTLYALLLPALAYCEEVTFRNVQFNGYDVRVLQFTKTIISSNSLKNNLPEIDFDYIEFRLQNIPVLREGAISDIRHLDELTIENCQLKKIEPGAFRNLRDLRKLNIINNDLEKLAEGVFNLLRIYQLDLSGNRIKVIESGALNNIPHLVSIRMDNNSIEAWNPSWFKNVPLLTSMSMQNNSIEHLPGKAFKNLKKEVSFYLGLTFSYNRIHTIEDDAFEEVGHINRLWLDHNKLSDFPDKLLEKVTIEHLHLEYNQIKCFQGDLVHAEKVHVGGTQLDCDCVERMKNSAQKNVDLFYATMDCTTERLNKKVAQLEKTIRKLVKDVEEVTVKNGADDEVELLNNF